MAKQNLGRIFFGIKKLGLEIFWVKEILGQKVFGSEKKFWSEICLRKKKLPQKKKFVKKKFGQKKFGQKKFWSEICLG